MWLYMGVALILLVLVRGAVPLMASALPLPRFMRGIVAIIIVYLVILALIYAVNVTAYDIAIEVSDPVPFGAN